MFYILCISLYICVDNHIYIYILVLTSYSMHFFNFYNYIYYIPFMLHYYLTETHNDDGQNL